MSEAVDTEGITLDYAPKRREDLTAVELDGEAVLYDARDGGVHKLDPVATVLWNSFDGSLTLRELVLDLDAVFDRDAETLARDLLGYTRQLGAVGLLEGVPPHHKKKR